MKNADKNRDPERARKRAKSDLRCAARKLGMSDAVEHLTILIGEAYGIDAVDAAAEHMRLATEGYRAALAADQAKEGDA